MKRKNNIVISHISCKPKTRLDTLYTINGIDEKKISSTYSKFRKTQQKSTSIEHTENGVLGELCADKI